LKIKVGDRVRHLLETLFTALLFGTQTILNAGIFISIMTIPLLPYMYYFLIGQSPFSAVEFELYVMFVSKTFLVGRIIALIGVVVLFIAAAQLLWNRHKGLGLINTGAYAVVRHPQFTGIIITTIGLTVMVMTNVGYGSPIQFAGLWLIQVLGYVAIAKYEDWRLSKKFGETYQQYKEKVPFLFPIKGNRHIPEILLTILITLLITVILMLFPYNLIRL
jgi:protein-S-isoprenylcysteine O-methyltransferase Ste14